MDSVTIAGLKSALRDAEIFDVLGRICAEADDLLREDADDWTPLQAKALLALLVDVKDVAELYGKLEAACAKVMGRKQ